MPPLDFIDLMFSTGSFVPFVCLLPNLWTWCFEIIIIISGFGIYGAAVVPDSGVGNTWQRFTLVLHEFLSYRVDTVQVAYSHIISHTCGPRLPWPPTISGAWNPQSRDGVDAVDALGDALENGGILILMQIGTTGSRGNSHAEGRFGSLAETSFSTPLGWIAVLVKLCISSM